MGYFIFKGLWIGAFVLIGVLSYKLVTNGLKKDKKKNDETE